MQISRTFISSPPLKSDWMWPWGKLGWGSLGPREFMVRTRGAVAWEWVVEGGLGGEGDGGWKWEG